jgi:hypothetical protein
MLREVSLGVNDGVLARDPKKWVPAFEKNQARVRHSDSHRRVDTVFASHSVHGGGCGGGGGVTLVARCVDSTMI